jgi:hypothetical protein
LRGCARFFLRRNKKKRKKGDSPSLIVSQKIQDDKKRSRNALISSYLLSSSKKFGTASADQPNISIEERSREYCYPAASLLTHFRVAKPVSTFA